LKFEVFDVRVCPGW